MNRFQPSTPRAALGLFAAAMTAFTIGVAVVAPAKMDVSAQHERFDAISNAIAAKPTLAAYSAHSSPAKQHG